MLPRKLVAFVCLLAAQTSYGFTVTVGDSMRKVRADQLPPQGTSISLKAARNEFESFQIFVRGPATGVSATASDLVGPSTIPAAVAGSGGNIRLYREELIWIDGSQLSSSGSTTTGQGWTPDALIPNVDELANEARNAFPFSVASSETRAIWVDVHVPANAPSGTYTGTVTVSQSGGSSQIISVTLQVWDFTLPSTSSLRSFFGLSYGTIPAQHGTGNVCSNIATVLKRYATHGLNHRISIGKFDDGCVTTSNLSHFVSQYGSLLDGTAGTLLPGAKLTSLEYLGGQSSSEYDTWANTFRTEGWFQSLFDYTEDEPSTSAEFNSIPPRASLAHTGDPDFRTLVTTSIARAQTHSVDDDINILCPIVNHLGKRTFEASTRPDYNTWLSSNSNNQVWTYQSCMSHGCGGDNPEFWPSYMIDASLVRARALEWMSFRNDVVGELYYEVTLAYTGSGDCPNGGFDPWDDQWCFSGNGDGTLFYPGTPTRIGGSTHIPVASMRLKMIREGMEDFEYMRMLQTQNDKAFAVSQVDAVFPFDDQAEQSPTTLLAAREAMACRILANQNKSCSPPSLTFAVIGDYGSGSSDEADVANLIAGWSPDVILTTGDNYYPSAGAGYEQSVEPFYGNYYLSKTLSQTQFFPTLGDHDTTDLSISAFTNYFNLYNNERYYDFVRGNVHFIALNNTNQEPDGNTVGSVQEQWMRGKLNASTATWKIVYFHKPPYSTGSVHGSHPFAQWDFSGADMVIAGDDHIYERIIKPGEPPYYVNGLGGSWAYVCNTEDPPGCSAGTCAVEASEVAHCYAGNFGAMKVVVYPSHMEVAFVDVNGTVHDAHTLFPSGGGGTPTSFNATADARVESVSPTTNFGAATILSIDNSPLEESFLTFDVTGVSGTVQSAKVRLRAAGTDTTGDGPKIFATSSSSWTESGINWNNRPAASGSALDDSAAIGTGQWVEYDVSSVVTGDGTYSFKLIGDSSDGIDFHSREASADRPELVVTTTTPPPTCSADDCFDRANGSLGADWTVFSGTLDIQSNQARATTGNTRNGATFSESVGADQDISAKCQVTGAGSHCALVARFNDANNYYYGYLDSGLGLVSVYRRSAGTNALLGQASRTIAANTYYRLRFVVTGNSLELYFNGETTPTVAVTDAAITGGNTGGIVGWAGSVGSVLWDDFDIVAASGQPPPPLFTDDFNRTTGLGSNWSVRYGSFSTDGTHAVSGTPPSNGNWVRLVPSLGTDDYSVSATIAVPAGSDFSGIGVRSNDTANVDRTLYTAQLSTQGTVKLFRRTEWSWTELGSASATIAAGTPYTLKVAVSGSNPVQLQVWLDGNLLISHSDTSADRITSGVPFLQNYDANVKYDWFTVD